MPPVTVLVVDGLDPAGMDLLKTAPGVVVRELSCPSEPELAEALKEADALVVRSGRRVDAALLARAPRLKVLGRPGAGLDHVDLGAARARGIAVVHAPGANAVAAAEHTLGLLLCLARGIPRADAAMRAGRWEKSNGFELGGRALGLVGCGQVGRALAVRAQGFGMRVAAHDPVAVLPPGVEALSLARLLEISDVVSLHLPLTEATRGLIGREALARMRPGAVLLNCARGALVDEAALAEALRSGRLAGAALDVFAEEPLPPGHPLAALDHVILTPHLGGATREAQRAVSVETARRLLAALDA